ncbi:hypothetical protein B0H11DRAFT_2265213 [Mycena galericulata]|nr:hypothetical protein B0H11DRAFT_2265213 [Mycena galericulata]
MLIDNYYDRDAAGKALDAVVRARAEETAACKDPAVQHMSAIDVDNIFVQQTGTNRKIWRLGPQNNKGSVDTKMVIRIQGILAKVELIPGNVSKFDTKRAANLSQRVQLVGAGSPLFETAIINTKVITDVFARFFRGKRINDWNVGEELTDTYLNASNRFFTSAIDEPDATAVPFGDGVDPLGVFEKLQRASSGQLVHTSDNVVHYFKLSRDPVTNEEIYYSAFPGTFAVGDIVEVHGSVTAFMNKQNVVKTHFHLQVMTLLDNTYSKASKTARLKAITKIAPTVSLRRPSAYSEEDSSVKSARKKFKAMSVGNDTTEDSVMEAASGSSL